MIQIALFTGLGLLGYILATQYNSTRRNPKETFLTPRPLNKFNDSVQLTQAPQGHNNMVPFFGAKVTQNLQAGANNGILDSFAGSGKEHFQKREIASLYDVAPGMGIPFGNANESDFYQSRMVGGMRMNNVAPIEKQRVGPGINDGYTDAPSGGYQQFNELQEYIKPRTTDELRTANKPKLSYDMPVIPGAHYITNPGLQAPVNKNRPDTFAVLTETDSAGNVSMPYLNTTTGAQVAPAAFAAQIQKEQQRESTNIEYYGAGGAAFSFSSYVRAFTEPFEQFMKLTVGEWFGSGGGSGGAYPEGTYIVDPYLAAYTNPGREASMLTNYQGPGYIAVGTGASSYGAVKTNKDEEQLINIRQFVDPANVVGTAATALQIGAQKFLEPLQQDIEVSRIGSEILDAFRSNPYTHSLQSVA
jgi:hypothetical protein